MTGFLDASCSLSVLCHRPSAIFSPVHPASVLSQPVGPITGLGLFTGVASSIVIHPGMGDGLIRFASPDGSALTPALASHLTGYVAPHVAGPSAGLPIRNTTLQSPDGSRTYATIEHLMAALTGLGILEATIVLDGPEVPILDGSALPFVEALLPHLVPASHPFRPMILNDDLTVHEHGASISAHVSDTRSRTYHLDYGPNSPLKSHAATWDGSIEKFISDIAPARTFSLRSEAEAARASGLFAAFSPRDLPVVADDGSLIDNAWRFPGEAAAHKLLDLIGDLALVGRPIVADITASKSGHALAGRFAAAVSGRTA